MNEKIIAYVYKDEFGIDRATISTPIPQNTHRKIAFLLPAGFELKRAPSIDSYERYILHTETNRVYDPGFVDGKFCISTYGRDQDVVYENIII